MGAESEKDLQKIFQLFFDEQAVSFETINTSRGELDQRITVIALTASENKYVIKLADNDFTFPDKIRMWQRTAGEYRRLGYYCPLIFSDKDRQFPTVSYNGHSYIAYAEEFAPYRSADRFTDLETAAYEQEKWIMTAKIAEKHFAYTSYPSGYCLFETFCPSDKTDEVLENAFRWKEYAQTLPDGFQAQVQRILKLWTDNRKALEPIYRSLPTSVFQADLNPSNILLDDSGNFVGVFDFNLCGREVFLNYLFREIYDEDFDKEISMIRRTLKIVSKHYHFSQLEKNTALMLYRCLKPLWFTKTEKLKSLQNDREAQKLYLDRTEQALAEPIDLASYMN